MPSTDSPGDPGRRAPGPLTRYLVVLLLANLALGGFLLFSQARLGRRLDKLEAADDSRPHALPGPSTGERPTLAGRPERIALLLAAATDAEASRRLLEAMPSGERLEIARALMGRPAGNDRNAALGALLQKMADEDPAQAVALLAAVPEAGVRQMVAAQIAAVWIEHDPAGSAAWLAGDGQRLLAPPALRRLRTAAVARWAGFDPAAATRFLTAQPPAGEGDAPELRATSREWARKDPAAALAWAQGLPSNDPRKAPVTAGVLEGWTDFNPAQAGGYVSQLAYNSSRAEADDAAAVVGGRWAERDPAAAAQWAATLPERTARHALVEIAAAWAAVDAPSAARWAAALPAGPARRGIWQGIGDDYAGTDPAGAENWLSTLPGGGDRDAAVAAYAAKVVPADPEKALTWAKTLSDSVFAAQQIQNLLAVWSRKDGLAARNWAVANQFVPVLPDGGR